MKAQHKCIRENEILFSTKHVLLFVVAFLLLIPSFLYSAPLTITVNDTTGGTITNYRWLLEEDNTYKNIPNQSCFNGNTADCLALNFHKSYMPVIAQGHSTDPMPNLDPTKKYYLSILPDANHTISGTQIAAGQTNASVTVSSNNVPTAQIRIFVFNDNSPINGAPDTPQETGIAGVKLTLEDAGGRYGISGQQISTDVYGNPLGTTYSAQGIVDVLGDGTITTDAEGFATIQNLAPGKYGIQAVPPSGSGLVQTSTIEGTHIIDAWVKANEPPFFLEFGPPGPHVFIGFTQQFSDNTVLNGVSTISGHITSLHNSRPPEFTFHSGPEVPGCWIGLNESNGGVAGRAVYAAPCDASSNFSIPNVPPGNYQLVVWDEPLDYIIAAQAVTVGNTNVNLGDVPIFRWFARIEQKVFNDDNENGIWDAGEIALPEQGTNIRWRDGTIYQSFPTDLSGEAPYDEVFPFFNWLVAEVAYDRFKATGVTVRVDDGGPLAPGEWMNPQPQSENGNQGFRSETGPVLTQAFQAFAGQTNILEWGKKPYATGENGGISGMVFYATTRAEDDPRYAGAEVWEPGIPRIQIALYEDNTGPGGSPDGVIDDLNGDSVVTLADVDNWPFGNFPSTEDFDYNNNGIFDAGDAIQITTTDSWDDNVPTNCQGDVYLVDGLYPTDCFDGLRNFNQVRPGVFDGGYAFSSYFPGGIESGSTEVNTLPVGTYIVASGEHKAYETVKEEDRNVDFGDTFILPNQLPPVCVGDLHQVPNDFSLYATPPDGPPSAGLQKPLCDRKQVLLSGGKNAAADFFMFTQVPTAAHIVGIMLNDLSNEFDPNAPAFGEKFAPPNLPISIRDWTGTEISRIYSDRWGTFNALVPSTYTNNLPSASGISPNMLTACMNDPGPINVNGSLITDPYFKREYSQFCYTLQYMPGVTTYLDTPVIPVSAFTGPGQFPLDCQYSDGTPVIWSVSGPIVTGPYVATAGDTLTIVSAGTVTVNNPDFGSPGAPQLISRDFGFGASQGQGSVTIGGNPATVTSWTNDTITVSVPAGGGQLEVIRDNGLATPTGIHVTVGGPVVSVSPGGSIQDAIDLAPIDSTVIIPPGTFNETVIMWKPLRLQGSGASTEINASNGTINHIPAWRSTVESLVNSGQVDLLPVQGTTFGPGTLQTEQGAGIFVIAKSSGPNIFNGKTTRIDGISITGSSLGGGIVINGYADGLEISNNRIFNNYSIYGGGIRIGHSIYSIDGINKNLNIHHNYVTENGSGFGAGGGISLNWGTDNYDVSSNYICGNYTNGNGGGIGHQGKSPLGLIANNTILFNQSFKQGAPVAGGGIFIGGGLGNGGALTQGSGSVSINNNLIQGNNAGAGNGGGISLANINGLDALNPDPNTWYSVSILNNTIVNNVAGLAGGGISLQDAAKVTIDGNTIAHNDTTATSGEAFCDTATGLVCDPNQSTPRAAGIVSYQHSGTLLSQISNSAAALPYNVFSNPDITNNIIWENRSFYFLVNNATTPATYGLLPDISTGDAPVFDDLAVYPLTAGNLNPLTSTLTDITGYDASNTNTDPSFVFDYFNGNKNTSVQQVELTTSISVQPAFDEGGNFIEVKYGPLTPVGDYSIFTLQPPGATTLVSPSGGGLGTNTPTYTWNAVNGSSWYYLWVDDVNGNAIKQWYTAASAGCDNGQVTCSVTPVTPLANGTVNWWVRTWNDAGLGPWSNKLSFFIGGLPSAATLISPSGITTNQPTYTWNAVADSTWYYIWVDDANGNAIKQWFTASAAGCGNGESTCAVTPATSLALGNGKWWVRTWNDTGLGPWSAPLNIDVQ